MTADTVSALPTLVVDRLADLVADGVRDHSPGHCVRVDSIRRHDAQALVAAVRTRVPAGSTDVHVLVEDAQADGVGPDSGATAIPIERAVELRNRKERQLVLMVPVGTGAAASSLDNSFARTDVASLLARAGEDLIAQVHDPDLAGGLRRVARELGRTRPVEAWARYVAAVVADPTWTTLGGALWMVGLIPDLGGPGLVDRLARNARCVRAISRPTRAVAAVPDRLVAAELQEGPEFDRIVGHLSRPDVDLSDVASWAAPLARDPEAAVLAFEHWPLGQRPVVDVERVRVDPFLKEDGTLRAGTRLSQDAPGDLPFIEVGEGRPASVTVIWRTDPLRTSAVDRWLLEALPPDDLRDLETEPVARQTVKGDKRRATVRIDVDEDSAAAAALLVVRVTALDPAGQPVLLRTGEEAVDESQQFGVRWNDGPTPDVARRASTPSLAQARLESALAGQDDHREDAPTWAGGAFSLRLGGRRTVQLALSPVLVELQRRALAERGRVLAWETDARLGELIRTADVDPVDGNLPPSLAERRRRVFGMLADRAPRDVVETLAWDGELRAEVAAYCQSYRRALDAATDPDIRVALLVLDTMRLSIETAGHAPIAAVIVLPLHPMRLAWAAEHDATLTRWADELAGLGRAAARRRQSVDARLVRRVAPTNLPFAVLGVDGLPFVHAREATLGTAVYLHPGDAEPGAAVQAAFDVLGLDRRDVAPELPPSVVAERIAAYRTAHPGEDALRMILSNAGSGELVAGALRESVLCRPDGDDEAAAPPPRVDITAYSSRRSLTDPLPALTDLQREAAGQQVRGPRSYLRPPLGLAVRPHGRLADDPAAAHLAVVADLAVVEAGGDADVRAVAVPDAATSFRNLLTPAPNQRVSTDNGLVVWRTAPAVRARTRHGAADAVDAHRSYQIALAAHLGHDGQTLVLTARLGAAEEAALRAAHTRSDWVLTLDRNLGIDLYTPPPETDGDAAPYILDYAPDFLEGLGPRLTVTTTHRSEVLRLLAEAMSDLHLDAVDSSVRVVLDHLQVVSGRLALRLVARSSLATEAVSLAALMAHLRLRNELDGTVVVPVDAHHEMFGDPGSEAGMRRCDVILVRTTARTLRMECVEVKSRRAAVLPTTLVDDIVDQLDSTVAMLRDTFFRVDPPRVDAELQRARLGGILRHHADRALAMGLLDERRRGELERLVERMEDGSLIPEISRRGYVVSLAGASGFPARHRGVRIDVLTAADLGQSGFMTSRREGSVQAHVEPEPSVETVPGPPPSPRAPEPANTSTAEGAEPARPRPSPRPRPQPKAAGTSSPDEGAALDESRRPTNDVAEPPPTEEPAPMAVDGGLVAGEHDTDAGGTAPIPVTASEPETVDVLLGQDDHADEVRWRISTKGSPHLFVLGIPGQGKSVTTRRILDSFAEQGLPALVVDFHGDMAAAPAGGAAVLDAARGLPISPFELDNPSQYRQTAWQLAEVIGYVCGLGEIQRNAVYESVCEVYERCGAPAALTGDPTMDELAEAAIAAEKAGRARNVVARLRPLTDFGLFVPTDGTRSFTDLLRQGVVVDVHPLMEQVQIAAGAFILRKVYREMFRWGQTGRLRLAVVLDEAHRLARDVTLPKIMKEGRKYGVAVVVASQGVADFHKDVLGNAGTKVAFRCNFPQSRTVAGFLRGRPGQDMAQALENLSVGRAYVSTPDHATARRVLMARS